MTSGKSETRQGTIDPLDGRPRGHAFVWKHFEIPQLWRPMRACDAKSVLETMEGRGRQRSRKSPRHPSGSLSEDCGNRFFMAFARQRSAFMLAACITRTWSQRTYKLIGGGLS
jgi:hypothetical protein